jgi:hypothetical protein
VQGCLDVGHILQEMTTSSNSSWQAGHWWHPHGMHSMALKQTNQ